MSVSVCVRYSDVFRSLIGNLFILFNDILLDIDECAIGADMCDANATCNNTVGSYSCTCNNGSTGNGFDCSFRGIRKKVVVVIKE